MRAVDPHPPGREVLLNPLAGQTGCGESVAHGRGRRGGLVVGHAVMVHAGTDSSGQVGVARHGEMASSRQAAHDDRMPFRPTYAVSLVDRIAAEIVQPDGGRALVIGKLDAVPEADGALALRIRVCDAHVPALPAVG